MSLTTFPFSSLYMDLVFLVTPPCPVGQRRASGEGRLPTRALAFDGKYRKMNHTVIQSSRSTAGIVSVGRPSLSLPQLGVGALVSGFLSVYPCPRCVVGRVDQGAATASPPNHAGLEKRCDTPALRSRSITIVLVPAVGPWLDPPHVARSGRSPCVLAA